MEETLVGGGAPPKPMELSEDPTSAPIDSEPVVHDDCEMGDSAANAVQEEERRRLDML